MTAHPRKPAAKDRARVDRADRVERLVAPPLALTLYWQGKGIIRMELALAKKTERVPALSPDATPQAKALHVFLTRYAQGERLAPPELPLLWQGLPPFTATVLKTLLAEVAHGQTLSYGELARRSGRPGAARAVGQAMARNPWPLVVPCHRVLGADQSLTGYTNPHGLDLKRLLLDLEGAGG